jgi:hypothetical protein
MLLMGGTGTGKTYAIRTLIDAGVTPFCVFVEPGFEVLSDIPPDKLHWRYIKPGSEGWETMIANHQKLNTASFATLAQQAPTDKHKYHQFIDLLKALNNYVCDRTGEVFGDTTKWNTDRCLVIDGLSGLSTMAMREWVGSKSLLNQGDWGVAMSGLEAFIQQLCYDTTCHTVLISHIERELDEALGISKIMASTLGKKLAPKIPKMFSDVVMAKRDGNKFSWTTADSSADLKARNLPIADNLKPEYAQVMEKWKKQGGIVCPTLPT